MIVRFVLFLWLTAALGAADFTTPGAITTPFPTLNHLALEWEIEGDEDLDATCQVKFRKEGGTVWSEGRPLVRVPAGKSRETSPIFAWTNRLSGSVFDLEPGTRYEVELQLHDPDGGSARRTVKCATRAEPVVRADAPVKTGSRADLNAVKPGEVLLLGDGDYGEVVFNRDGEPGRPIVYRSFSGKATFREISLTNRKWVYLEGVTVNGPVRMNGSEHCVVRRCRIRSQFGIKAYKPGMMNACIEDNVITGIREWAPEIMGAGGDNEGEGIQFTGSGNVIRHNRVSGFRDCISHMEDEGAVLQSCNDILNNDIGAGLDDGIEADFASHNCRVLRNRLTNCFVGISSQPGLGGPNYFLRNVMFNIVLSPFKLHRFSQGDVIMHNTVVKAGDGLGIHTSEPFDHAVITHNLFICGPAPSGATFGGYSPGRGRAVDVQRFGIHCVIDHNAYAVLGRPFEGKIRDWTFQMLPGTEFETRGRVVEVQVPLPEDPARLYQAPDLSKLEAVGAGAYAGESVPLYGPRPHPASSGSVR
ncbi:MAG: Right handed beta helix region [Verrucomicrobia bacterium]|nr:MAG: Right handed beta helix region [Verrucomicrobiota bacterium]